MVFSAILGQPKAVKLIERALQSGRLAHAYLFSGPDGVGKTTMANALAGMLFCQAGSDDKPCGRCHGCRQFNSGNHPDFVRMQPDGAAIKIDQVRELKKTLSFAPFEGGKRVVILEEVQSLRREAGNSLLKLLEEPPPENILVLIGSSDQLLSTIVSRCQVIPFNPLPMELAIQVIRDHRPELDNRGVRALAALSEGCPGKAMNMDMEDDSLLELYVRLLNGLTEPPATEAEKIGSALSLAAEMAARKSGLEPLLELFRIFIKDVMVATTCPPRAEPISPQVDKARELWNLQQLSAMLLAVDFAEKALARNCNRALTCEVLLLELMTGNAHTM